MAAKRTMPESEIICLRSRDNNKYLRFCTEDNQGRGLVQCSGDTIMDPLAQFQTERSKTWFGMVHLKSRYNNKYLVRWSPKDNWVSASAYAPDENLYSWTCTLFRPVVLEQGRFPKVQLKYVPLDQFLCLSPNTGPIKSCLYIAPKDVDKNTVPVFDDIHWEPLLKLPNYVAFKARDGGKYLGAYVGASGKPFLQFSYDDPNDPKVRQQIFLSPDGSICIKSTYFNKFWRLGDEQDYIWADADDPRGTDNTRAMFRTNVVDIDAFALMNMGQNKFCKRFTSGNKVSLLCANTKEIDRFAVLEVTELE